MSEDQRGFWGCMALIGIALLIGVGLRSKSFVQFLVMGAGIVFGILFVFWSFSSFFEEGCWSKLTGLWCGFIGVSLAITVGHFLITGNYDQSVQLAKRIWRQATPTPAASAQSEATPKVTLTPTEVVQAAATPTPTPKPTATHAPMPTPTPVPTAAPEATATPSPTETAWYSKFLADRSIAQPISEQIKSWRLYLGIILGVQYLIALYVARRTRKGNIGGSLIGGIVGALLVFTKLGEWIYKIILWVFGWGLFGKIVAVILALLTGLGGIGNLTAYIIAGYLYYDVQVMGLCVLPSVIIGFIVLVVALSQARERRYL